MSKPTSRSVLLATEQLSTAELDELENLFFNQVVLPNGTYKTTCSGRLDDIDRLCTEYLEGLGLREELRILDLAVSSGVTTVDWINWLDSSSVSYSLDAIDICVDASILTFAKNFEVLVDSNGRALRFELLGCVEENHLGDSLGRMIRRVLPISAMRLAYRVAKSVSKCPERVDVKLVSHRLRNAQNVRILELDMACINELPSTYHCIRAANILNVAYFDREFIQETISKIKGKLESDGILCVVRTHPDGSNHGGIYRLKDRQFNLVQSVGRGSEVDQIIRGSTQ